MLPPDSLSHRRLAIESASDAFVLLSGANIVQNSPMFMKAPDKAP